MLISVLICSKNIPASLFLSNTNCTYLNASQFCTIDRHALNLDRNDKNKIFNMRHLKQAPWFVRVLENLESPGILLWHFPGLESPGKSHWSWKVLEICLTQLKIWNVWKAVRRIKIEILSSVVNVNFRALEKSIWALEKSWKSVSEKGYKAWGTNTCVFF